MHRPFLSVASWLPWALIVFACSGGGGASDAPSGDTVSSWYVTASAASGGDGSQQRPFDSLAKAEEASGPGDVIYVLPAESEALLDGGIALQENQKLLGLGPGGAAPGGGSALPRLTNTTDHLGGVIVELSRGNEVADLHFVDMRNHAIQGVGGELTETFIHHSLFEGAAESEEILWSVRLESNEGTTINVRVTDCEFRDGDALGGIQIHQSGESSGDYQFERNTFSDLGGRAYHLLTEDSSSLQASILDSTADNIGHGERNSDSILPHLRNSSQQTVFVSNYHYDNTKQVGSSSNTGLESFLEGAPFPNQESWCDGCKLKLRISDSVFENSVTDGIQLINFGSNSEIDAVIRNTRVIGAKPQQVGGGISLLSQNVQNTGNRNKLLIENCDVIGSSQFGIAISDEGEGFTSIVDLGGGELGSSGNNRILDSASGELRAINANPVAKNNWWGGRAPRVELVGDASTFDGEPALETDPRSASAPRPGE